MHTSNGRAENEAAVVLSSPKARNAGRSWQRFWSSNDRSAESQFEWSRRTCILKNAAGEVIFEQHDVEAPTRWSDMAALVVASKYFSGALKSDRRESSVRNLVARVVGTITEWGTKDGYFASKESAGIFRDELTCCLLGQKASFNSPVWFNVGVRPSPQTSACFIVSVDDSLNSLSKLQATETALFKYGSGVGTNFSAIRSENEKLSGGGTASGPLSFMRALDSWAGIIKSGGKTRRAAKMMILNVDHPDVLEFIQCKAKEELKAHALIDAGFDGSFSAKGGAYESVAFQNANLSVRVSDDFMQAVVDDKSFALKSVVTHSTTKEPRARDILREVAIGTHSCGDPGMQFDSTINAWHTCPNSGRINASNPCSEYMSIDNSACNLASINLLAFLNEDSYFEVEGFAHAIRLLITAQDILINNSSYPRDDIGQNARKFRQLGLGYTNLGAALMCQGLAYDSEAARHWAACITAILTGVAYKTSSELARDTGAFSEYATNQDAMLAVIKNHRTALDRLDLSLLPPEIYNFAIKAWDDALSAGREFGYRNSQTTVLAPTGTISFMMDCDTTGIEPDISLIKYKKLSDGGVLSMANRSLARALRSLKYSQQAISAIEAYVVAHGTLSGCIDIEEQHLSIFDCALASSPNGRIISPLGHLKMMAAVQPFISGAISKTVNLPASSSVEEIESIYIDAWKMGLKAVALYRDGSKRTQPLQTKTASAQVAAKEIARPARRGLPAERASITHRFSVGGLKGYITTGLYQEGTPGEIFLTVAKEGSTLSGVMDAFATAVSLGLQHGVPLETFIKKFKFTRFEPSGFSQNSEIPFATSIIDYIFRWLEQKFSPSTKEAIHRFDDAPPCTSCGSSMMVRQGNCYICLQCGTQGGCS